MQKAFEERRYEDPVWTQKIKNKEIEVNLNALTLVVECVNKLYNLTLEEVAKVYKKGKINKQDIKRIYIKCSKLYMAD